VTKSSNNYVEKFWGLVSNVTARWQWRLLTWCRSKFDR